MTGFFIIARGLSFRNASTIARLTICQFQITCLLVVLAILLSSLGFLSADQKVFPAYINRCSTIGPRLSAGKNVNAPTITMTLTSNVVNSGVVTGNVPNDGGTIFSRARLPATASIGMIIMKRPTSIVMPIVVLYQRVFAEMPAKAEPLFPAPSV